MFNLLYLVNQIVYPQSDEFPIIYGTRPLKIYQVFSICVCLISKIPAGMNRERKNLCRNRR